MEPIWQLLNVIAAMLCCRLEHHLDGDVLVIRFVPDAELRRLKAESPPHTKDL